MAQGETRLGDKYSVIYEIDGVEVRVMVMELTAHDDRRK